MKQARRENIVDVVKLVCDFCGVHMGFVEENEETKRIALGVFVCPNCALERASKLIANGYRVHNWTYNRHRENLTALGPDT